MKCTVSGEEFKNFIKSEKCNNTFVGDSCKFYCKDQLKISHNLFSPCSLIGNKTFWNFLPKCFKEKMKFQSDTPSKTFEINFCSKSLTNYKIIKNN